MGNEYMGMAHDKAKYHYDGDFPEDLEPEQGGTHIGMYYTWLADKGLLNFEDYDEEFKKETEDSIQELLDHKTTPGIFLIENCDGTLLGDEISQEGNEFTNVYYLKSYDLDYLETLDSDGQLPSLYHIADTWENYIKLKPVLDKRFEQWKNGELKSAKPTSSENSDKKWWQFWK